MLRAPPAPAVTAGERPRPGRPPLHKLVPWFIIGFLALAAARSFGIIPEAALHPVATVTTWLTILSMAALGLGVDVRAVAAAVELGHDLFEAGALFT